MTLSRQQIRKQGGFQGTLCCMTSQPNIVQTGWERFVGCCACQYPLRACKQSICDKQINAGAQPAWTPSCQARQRHQSVCAVAPNSNCTTILEGCGGVKRSQRCHTQLCSLPCQLQTHSPISSRAHNSQCHLTQSPPHLNNLPSLAFLSQVLQPPTAHKPAQC